MPHAPAPTANPRHSGRDVLCVAPDPFMGELVRGTLAAMGCRVTLVLSAEAALFELGTLPDPVVVIDDPLGQGRGYELLGRVLAEHPAVEAVLMTADRTVVSVVEALRVARVHCLDRHFGREDLRRAVTRALTHAGEGAEAAATRAAPDTPAPPRGMPDLPAGLRVLVVDDDPLVRRSMARAFRGHKVTLAENGRAATTEIEREMPDLIVSDLRMPEMDGLAFADEVGRRWPELSDRILFFSGTDSHIERAKHEAPHQPILRKSASGEELARRVAEVLETATRRARA
jgi:DNA-binding NtrC family response regulator